MTFVRTIAAVVSCLLLGGAITAQPTPITLNTTLRSFTLTAGMADVWTYIDSQGRDFALICGSSNGLMVYDVSNPDAPVFADSIPTTGSDLKDVKIAGQYAYVCQESGDALIVDLADPYNISVVGTVPGIGAHNGEVGDGYWVFASVPGGTQIWSLANPIAPTLVTSIAGSSHDATIDGDRLYIHSFSGTQTHIYDISNINAPVQLGSIPYGNHSGAVYDTPGNARTVMVCNESSGGYCQIWDVTDGTNPSFLSNYQTPGYASISVHNPVEMGDRYICISYYADFLRIVDLANPSQPEEVGIYDPDPLNIGGGLFSGCWGAVPLKEIPGGWRILVGNRNSPPGFYVVDFTPPPVLDVIGSTTGGGDFSIAVSGADPFGSLYNLISLQTAGPLGGGPVAGIGHDAFFILANQLGAPFAVNADNQGAWSLSAPAGTFPVGLTMDFVSLSPVSGIFDITQVGRMTF